MVFFPKHIPSLPLEKKLRAVVLVLYEIAENTHNLLRTIHP